MIIPDANLLIYAYDEASPYHQRAKTWWENALSNSEPVGIPMVVLLAFTRILTHTSICQDPLTPSEVWDRVRIWFAQPQVRILSISEDSLGTFFELMEKAGRGGNLSTDALIAVHAREHSAVVHTNDSDFTRFPGIQWFNPL